MFPNILEIEIYLRGIDGRSLKLGHENHNGIDNTIHPKLEYLQNTKKIYYI